MVFVSLDLNRNKKGGGVGGGSQASFPWYQKGVDSILKELNLNETNFSQARLSLISR